MQEKVRLYLDQGAKEVWLYNQQGEISYYSTTGKLEESKELEASDSKKMDRKIT
jgi:Uma2 family endonuclease